VGNSFTKTRTGIVFYQVPLDEAVSYHCDHSDNIPFSTLGNHISKNVFAPYRPCSSRPLQQQKLGEILFFMIHSWIPSLHIQTSSFAPERNFRIHNIRHEG
jgi:hypothetical protein